ncbi:MAG: protein-L-isoaspartate(D-aspartate) O-methyltransferase [Candidatus Bathyarchaeia archaeon]
MGEGDIFSRRRRMLIDRLIAEGVLKERKVIEALLRVPREKFLPEGLAEQAYDDNPLPIGYGKTISAPHMVAIMNEALELEKGHKVLEVGAGSGYHAATIAEIVAPKGEESNGHVYTVEIVPQLVEQARANLEETSYSPVVTVVLGDGSLGYPEKAPYDRILVTAAAPQIPPALVEQLKPGGQLVIPVGGLHSFQSLVVARKGLDGKLRLEDRGGVAFVPLLGKYGFQG